MIQKAKIFKQGNSYAIRISKHWINQGVLKEGDEISFLIPVEFEMNPNGRKPSDNKNAVFGMLSRNYGQLREALL